MWFLLACHRPDQLAPEGDVDLGQAQVRVLGTAPIDDEDAALGWYGLAATADRLVATDFGVGARRVDPGTGRDTPITAAYPVSVALLSLDRHGDPALVLGQRSDFSTDTRAGTATAALVLAPSAETDEDPRFVVTDRAPRGGGTNNYRAAAFPDLGNDGHGDLVVCESDPCWWFDGVTRDLEVQDDADLVLHGVDGLRVAGLPAVGDLDGDGDAELAVPVVDGGYVGGVAIVERDGDGAVGRGGAFVAVAGTPVSGGDLTGDGQDDLVVVGGSVWVFAGPLRGTLGADDAVARLDGSPTPSLAFGAAAIAKDLDGDGQDDLLAGAPGDDTSDPGGAVAVWYGPVRGVRTLPEADARLLGETPGDAAGAWVAGPGDTDGDGYGDVVVAAVGAASGRGAVYVLRGGPR